MSVPKSVSPSRDRVGRRERVGLNTAGRPGPPAALLNNNFCDFRFLSPYKKAQKCCNFFVNKGVNQSVRERITSSAISLSCSSSLSQISSRIPSLQNLFIFLRKVKAKNFLFLNPKNLNKIPLSSRSRILIPPPHNTHCAFTVTELQNRTRTD